MISQFQSVLSSVADDAELSSEFLIGFRRGLQRGLYGERVVADAEHEAWLAMARDGQSKWAERSRGYADGVRSVAERDSAPT